MLAVLVFGFAGYDPILQLVCEFPLLYFSFAAFASQMDLEGLGQFALTDRHYLRVELQR